MREWFMLAAYAVGAFSFPLACGAVANYSLGQHWNAPVGGSVSHYEAR